MPKKNRDPAIMIIDPAAGSTEGMTEVRRQARLLTGALQNVVFNNANFYRIAMDANGLIQKFNVGAQRMLGYTPADMNKIIPVDIFDPQELFVRAKALSNQLGTAITTTLNPWYSRPRATSNATSRIFTSRPISERTPAVCQPWYQSGWCARRASDGMRGIELARLQ